MKLRLYELGHESKMWLLDTRSHTSNGLAIEPGTREEKQLKKTQTLQQGNPTIKTLPRTAAAAGGAENALEPAAYRRCGGGKQKRLYGKQTTEQEPAAYRRCGRGEQKRLYGEQITEKATMVRRALVDMEGNTGDNTRKTSYQNLPRAIGMARG